MIVLVERIEFKKWNKIENEKEKQNKERKIQINVKWDIIYFIFVEYLLGAPHCLY